MLSVFPKLLKLCIMLLNTDRNKEIQFGGGINFKQILSICFCRVQMHTSYSGLPQVKQNIRKKLSNNTIYRNFDLTKCIGRKLYHPFT
jgi:hypothetical protein